MGRYYQTTDPVFTDYMFRENLDIAKLLTDQRNREALSRARLLNRPDLVIDYAKELDEEAMRREQNLYAEKVDGITDRIMKASNPFEKKRAMDDLNLLQRELNESFATGELARIQQNAGEWKRFGEENKLISPERRKKYSDYYLDRFNQSEDKKFSFDTMYDPMDFGSEILTSKYFTELKENEKITNITREGDGYRLYTTGNTSKYITKKAIENAARMYVDSNRERITGYGTDMERVFGEKGWTKDGQLDMSPEGVIGKLVSDIGKNYSYNNTSHTSSVQSDSARFSIDRAMSEANPDSPSLDLSFGSNVEDLVLSTPQGQRELNSINNKRWDMVKAYGTKEDYAVMARTKPGSWEQNKMLNDLRNRVAANDPNAFSDWTKREELYEMTITSSFEAVKAATGNLVQSKKQYETVVKNLNSENGRLGIGLQKGVFSFDGNLYTTDENGNKISVPMNDNQLVGKQVSMRKVPRVIKGKDEKTGEVITRTVYEHRVMEVLGTEPIPGSAMVIATTDNNGMMMPTTTSGYWVTMREMKKVNGKYVPDSDATPERVGTIKKTTERLPVSGLISNK